MYKHHGRLRVSCAGQPAKAARSQAEPVLDSSHSILKYTSVIYTHRGTLKQRKSFGTGQWITDHFYKHSMFYKELIYVTLNTSGRSREPYSHVTDENKQWVKAGGVHTRPHRRYVEAEPGAFPIPDAKTCRVRPHHVSDHIFNHFPFSFVTV